MSIVDVGAVIDYYLGMILTSSVVFTIIVVLFGYTTEVLMTLLLLAVLCLVNYFQYNTPDQDPYLVSD